MDNGAIRCGQEVCGNLEAALEREWLETNGLGGFASSTIAGVNTRRYHGLLTAALKPPVGRYLLLSKLEETVIIGGRRFELSTNCYPGVIHPSGHQYLKEFRLDPFPIFIYQADGVEIEKRLFLVHGENTTVVEYELRALDRDPAPDCVFEVRPLIAFRDYHSTTHRNGALNPAVAMAPGMASVAPYAGLPALHFAHDAESVELSGYWYENFEYREERERGLDYREDLFNPFVARFPLCRRKSAAIIVSTGRRDAAEARELREREIERRAAVIAASPCAEPIVRALTAAADQFIVKRGEMKTIIAGYHWFSDWGRDTMIALPGLTLAVGRHDTARRILAAFAAALDRGMLPNRFPDGGEAPEYNTVDATLWFFEAVRAYVSYSGDSSFVRDGLYEKLKEVVDWHLRGTRYGIRVDTDGLLCAGEPGVQLTWMDAKVGDWVVTPRHGKAVEIQALWYNALRVLEGMAGQFGDAAAETFCCGLARQASESFNRGFWNDEAGCLYDVVNGESKDGSIRPNQILAVSLPHSMLPEGRARRVVEVVRRELLTPAGLRSLAPGDPAYRPRYEGGVYDRDSAYHQGTVWPWLMGPFLTAFVKVNGRSREAREQAARWLAGFGQQLRTGCLGQIAEIADAEAPHVPRGCAAQAWSAAELLRAAVEDIFVDAAGTRRNQVLLEAAEPGPAAAYRAGPATA